MNLDQSTKSAFQAPCPSEFHQLIILLSSVDLLYILSYPSFLILYHRTAMERKRITVRFLKIQVVSMQSQVGVAVRIFGVASLNRPLMSPYYLLFQTHLGLLNIIQVIAKFFVSRSALNLQLQQLTISYSGVSHFLPNQLFHQDG